MKLDEILRVPPEDAEAAAARARQRALWRFDREPVPERRPGWKPAAALAVLCMAAIGLTVGSDPVETAGTEERVGEPLRVQMTLSDGTRVEWTFHENFRL
jgi:ferric-dicitrate binding protein FerR (iron transport regulator)